MASAKRERSGASESNEATGQHDAREEDKQLILAAQAGDMKACDVLLERWLPKILAVAKKHTPSHLIDDAVQAVSIRLLKSISRFDAAKKVTVATWFYNHIIFGVKDFLRTSMPKGARRQSSQEARNEATKKFFETASLDELFSRGENDIVGNLYDVLKDDDCDYDAEVYESEDNFDYLLSTLREPLRTIVELRFRRDWTMADIGKQVGCCESRVSQVLAHELPRLGERLLRIRDGAHVPKLIAKLRGESRYSLGKRSREATTV